jgi:hypothetical protein
MDRTFWWWIRQAGLILLGGGYLYFGIRMLVGAYALNNPLTFIMIFFASNFIILISAALVAGFIYRLVAAIRQSEPDADPGNTENDPADDEARHR